MTLSPNASTIYLITGPMAAGKSTVARLLAERFERGVHLEGDVFRRSIVSGRAEMTADPTPDAVEQLRLRYRLAAAAADAYCEAGFTVALEDVAAGPLLEEYTRLTASPCHVVVLLPSLEAIAAREAGRPARGYTRWELKAFYDGFEATTPRLGLWLDTSRQAAEETVDDILSRLPPPLDPIVVSEYDDAWPRLFWAIAEPVRQALGATAVAIEHVGSTAVPGLAAKPVIDVAVVVRSEEDVAAAIARLRDAGYVHQGDRGIPGREAFRWPRDATRHHLYVVREGGNPHFEFVRFRDYLRSHPDVAHEYAELKRALAERHRSDRAAYTEAKGDFVARVLADAAGSA